MMKYVLSIAALVSLFAAAPSHAVSNRELAQAINDLHQRLMVVEDRVLTGDPAAIVLQERVNTLEASQRQLTGELERLQFELEQAHQRVLDLEDRLAAMQRPPFRSPYGDPSMGGEGFEDGAGGFQEGMAPGGPTDLTGGDAVGDDFGYAAVPSTGVLGTIPAGSLQGDAAGAYAYARGLLAASDFAGAETALETFLAQYPTDPLSGEARFWLGEAKFVQGMHLEAAEAYKSMLKESPKDPLAPKAMMKMGQALSQAGEKSMACKVFAALPTQYPEAGDDVLDRTATLKRAAGC